MKQTALAFSTLLLAGMLTAACGDPQDPCQVNPTRQAADGQWVEADGEPLDDDPCDAENTGHWPKPVKTKPKPAVTKRSTR